MAELHAEERTANTSLHKDCSGNDVCGNGDSPESCSMNGDVQGRRLRPVSVMDLFSPDAEEKDDRLPSVSLYSYSLNLLYISWRYSVESKLASG